MNVHREIPRPGYSERGLSRGKSQRPMDILNNLFAGLAVLSTDGSRPNDIDGWVAERHLAHKTAFHYLPKVFFQKRWS